MVLYDLPPSLVLAEDAEEMPLLWLYVYQGRGEGPEGG